MDGNFGNEIAKGGAYVLPQESQAANGYLDTLAYNHQVDLQNQQNKQKQAQALAQSYKDNAFKAKTGTLFTPELNALDQQHLTQGAQYAKGGGDIYDPSHPGNVQYMSDRSRLLGYHSAAADIEKAFDEDQQLLAKATPGKYDPDSIKAEHDFVANNKIQDIVDKGMQLPRIQEAFDPDKVLSKVEPVMTGENDYVKGNRHIDTNFFKPKETANNVEQMYMATPGGAQYIQKQTGLTPQYLRSLPSSNLQDIGDYNDQLLKNTQQGQQLVAQSGITSYSDPKYQQLLQAKSAFDQQAKQKYDGLIQQGVDLARAKAKQIYKNVPDYTYAREAREEQERQDAHQKFLEGQQVKGGGQVMFGNSNSTVPVVQVNTKNGKIGGEVTSKETGATLFSMDFPQTKVQVSPPYITDLNTGHSVPNTNSIEVNAGTVKMEPVFDGLDKTDSRNGSVISKRQLEEIYSGKSKAADLSNIAFQPMVYGETQTDKKDINGHTVYRPVAFPYDAVRGNTKIKTANFDKTEQQFRDFLNSDVFKKMTPQQQLGYFEQQFQIK